MRVVPHVAGGLEDVVVADSALSCVDGEGGRLIIRGHDIEELAEHATFEQMCALLWRGRAPTEQTRTIVREQLGEARVRAFRRVPGLLPVLARPDGMDALRAALAQLELDERDAEQAMIDLTASTAVYAAAWGRLRRGQSPVAPDPESPHASDYLQAAGGHVLPAHARAADAYLVTVADHGMNASTFTARVITSTRASAVSAVAGAVGALSGPLHGGAPGPVLDLLDAIEASGDPRGHIEGLLAAGERIMGMGHRVYRVRDPRAQVLEGAALGLRDAGRDNARLRLARAVEEVAVECLARRHPGRSLRANVEWYTAVLLEALGLTREQFSPTFAVGRVAGWCAHILEQRAEGRLIRPRLRSVGVVPEGATVDRCG